MSVTPISGELENVVLTQNYCVVECYFNRQRCVTFVYVAEYYFNCKGMVILFMLHLFNYVKLC